MKEFLPVACEGARKPERSKGDGRLIRGCQLRFARLSGGLAEWPLRWGESRDYRRINAVLVNEIPSSGRTYSNAPDESEFAIQPSPSFRDGVNDIYRGGVTTDQSGFEKMRFQKH